MSIWEAVLLIPKNNRPRPQAMDIYGQLSQNGRMVWYLTGETTESLTILSTQIQFPNSYNITPMNRLLITFIWLRHYPTYSMLESWFGVSASTIHRIIYSTVDQLWHLFRGLVRWPTRPEWKDFRGTWERFPNALSAIDGTLHEIFRPQTDPQHLFYSGHARYHCMSTQVSIL